MLTVLAVPAPLAVTSAGGSLTLAWPGGLIGYRLEVQTNNSTIGLSTNWIALGYDTTNSVRFPINSGNGSVFYRLVYP